MGIAVQKLAGFNRRFALETHFNDKKMHLGN
jgi:hypothetical protein